MADPARQLGRSRERQESPSPRTSAGEIAPLSDFLAGVELIQVLESRGNLSDPEKEALSQVNRILRNCCGQYAIATVCQAHGRDLSLKSIIDQTNPCGIFTGPFEIISFLKKHGIPSTEHNRGSEVDLATHSVEGKLIIMLVNAGVKSGTVEPHWVVVGGLSRDESGNFQWNISDAASMSGSPTFVGRISHDDLMQAWKSPLGTVGKISGYSNYWIAVDEKPGMFDRALASAASSHGAHLVNQTAKGLSATAKLPQTLIKRLRGLAGEADYSLVRLPSDTAQR